MEPRSSTTTTTSRSTGEWSDTAELSIDYTNDAYKLGINYVIYSMMR